MRMRARSSVGTCALSKLLSRHKLLVSDQFLTSQYIYMLGRWIASLLCFDWADVFFGRFRIWLLLAVCFI